MKSSLLTASVPKPRILSIDILRGAVMLVMALGHTRHLLHLPALTEEPTDLVTTTPVLFFTRWISHYCVSTFVFLAGISIFITGQQKNPAKHSSFIIKRGCWLVIVEVMIITFALTFNPSYSLFILQVIWATGWSMVVLGLLLKSAPKLIPVIGCLLFFGHNLLDYVQLPQHGFEAGIWKLLFTANADLFQLGNRSVLLLYAILPWTGIMLLGYSFGTIYRKEFDDRKRKKILVWTGLAFILLFLVLRFMNKYGDPAPWSQQKNSLFTVFSFLNTTKYPVSLQYGCMTLGPVLLLLAILENAKAHFTGFLSTLGRTAFFFYILHFFVIHLVVLFLFFASGHTWAEAMIADSPFLFRPYDFGFSLGVVYGIWLLLIPLLFLSCRWFARYKRTHHQWWLRYL